jgi:hypothetical protein
MAEITKELLVELGLIKDRKYGTFITQTYTNCFVGNEVVTWMVEKGIAADRPDAVKMGCELVRNGKIHHVCDDHHFEDGFLFYRFLSDEPAKVLAQRRHFSALGELSMGSELNVRSLIGSWSTKYFCLQGETLFVYKNEYAISPTAAYSLEGAKCSVTECEECHAGKYAFTLEIDDQKQSLSANQSKVQEAWLAALTAAGAKFIDLMEESDETASSSLFDLSANSMDSGEELSFSHFAGKVCIIVNVASA